MKVTDMSSIYMHIPNIQGSCTELSHKDWITIDSLSWRIRRNVTMRVGKGNNRESDIPAFSEVLIMKSADASSSMLFAQACSGKVIPQIQIDICITGDSLKPYSQYTLYDVIVSHYEDSVQHDANQPNPNKELVALNFTKIEKKFTPYDSSHSAQGPITSSYDLATAQSG